MDNLKISTVLTDQTNCTSFKDMSKEKLCKMFVLTDCAVQVQLSEKMFFGKVLSNLTVCDEYKHDPEFVKLEQIQSGPENGIFDVFYQIYMSLRKVL